MNAPQCLQLASPTVDDSPDVKSNDSNGDTSTRREGEEGGALVGRDGAGMCASSVRSLKRRTGCPCADDERDMPTAVFFREYGCLRGWRLWGTLSMCAHVPSAIQLEAAEPLPHCSVRRGRLQRRR